jgi:hypothetical protein
MTESMTRQDGRRLVAGATPVFERVMFLFNPPGDMTPEQMRRKSLLALAGSAVLMALVYGLTPAMMRMRGPVSSLGFGFVLMFYGFSFLIVPASLFRLMFGITDKNDGNSIIRGFVAVVLFFVTAIGSCLLYGQINN